MEKKKQKFKYMWVKPQEGSYLVPLQNVIHAIGNCDLYPSPFNNKPNTSEEKVMLETLDAVFTAIETIPKYTLRYEMLVVPEEANKRLVSVYKESMTDFCMIPLGVSNFIDDIARCVPVIEREDKDADIFERIKL